MSSNLPYKQAANVERRTWDKETYEARARARNEAATGTERSGSGGGRGAAAGSKRPMMMTGNDADGAVGVAAAMADEKEKEEFVPAAKGAAGPERSQRAYLKARRSKVDLESKLGTSEIINPDAVTNSGGSGGPDTEGGAVSITDGVTKSSTGVGWHCKVCDCYLKDSMTYLDHINGRKHQRYLGFSMRVEKSTKSDVTSKLSVLAEEKRKAELVAASNPAAEGGDDSTNAFEDAVRKKDDDALKLKAERARRKEERKRKEQEEQEEEEAELNGGLDPTLAAMMGFSGFGSTSKN